MFSINERKLPITEENDERNVTLRGKILLEDTKGRTLAFVISFK
jgi:hypothetical protein